MDKIKAMQAFVDIVESGSLTAAAEISGKSLPSMVRILAELESSLGVTLINRTTRRIALTEEGSFYLQQCKSILAQIKDAEIFLNQDNKPPRGNITISVPVKFGQLYVMPLVKEYLKAYPDVSIHLTFSNKIIDLLEGRVDFSIRISPLKDSTLVAKKIGVIRSFFVASPEGIKKYGLINAPAGFEHVPCIIYKDNVAEAMWTFEHGSDTKRINVSGNFSTNDVDAALEACLAGLGYGRFFSYQVLQYLEEGTLDIIYKDTHQPDIPISIVYPTARLIPNRTRHAIDWFYQRLKEQQYL